MRSKSWYRAVLAVSFLCFVATDRFFAQTAPNQPAAAAGAVTIDIPDGTPLVIHVYGWGGLADDFQMNSNHVIQVDRAVVVNNVVVIPKGSLGLATFNKGDIGMYRSDLGLKTKPGLLGLRAGEHDYGQPKRGLIRAGFKCLYVWSISSTKLEVNENENIFDPKSHNAAFGMIGFKADINAEFTVTLKHAVLTLPSEERR